MPTVDFSKQKWLSQHSPHGQPLLARLTMVMKLPIVKPSTMPMLIAKKAFSEVWFLSPLLRRHNAVFSSAMSEMCSACFAQLFVVRVVLSLSLSLS